MVLPRGPYGTHIVHTIDLSYLCTKFLFLFNYNVVKYQQKDFYPNVTFYLFILLKFPFLDLNTSFIFIYVLDIWFWGAIRLIIIYAFSFLILYHKCVIYWTFSNTSSQSTFLRLEIKFSYPTIGTFTVNTINTYLPLVFL